MRSMGLDLGSVTLGIALSDPTGFLASPVTTLRYESDDYVKAIELLLPVIAEKKPENIILGLPKHMNGDIGIKGELSIKFKEMLEEKVSIPVILWDERLTTLGMQKELISFDVSRSKRKKIIDQMAAVSILQSYLDSQKRG